MGEDPPGYYESDAEKMAEHRNVVTVINNMTFFIISNNKLRTYESYRTKV